MQVRASRYAALLVCALSASALLPSRLPAQQNGNPMTETFRSFCRSIRFVASDEFRLHTSRTVRL